MDADKAIICSLASDLRKGLGADNTLKNCVNSIYLPYKEEQDFAGLAVQYRNMMNEQKEENYIQQNANSMIYLFEKITELPTLEAKAAALAVFDNLKINTYVLSYTGKTDLPDCESYIDSMHLYSGGNNGLFINMMAVGDTITIDLLQSFQTTAYKEQFQSLLEAAGIEFEVSERISFTTPRDEIRNTLSMEKNRARSNHLSNKAG
ncbi:MAG: hypothetical protein ACRDBO_17850 [Lachnospiraceae bacterium]